VLCHTILLVGEYRGDTAIAGLEFSTTHGGIRVQLARLTEFQVLN
jgi:hypothetical protein